MLKKLLSLLLLTAITSTSICMEEIGEEEPTDTYSSLDQKNPLVEKFNQLIFRRNENKIIKFFNKNENFVIENLSFIIARVCQENLLKIVKFIKGSYDLDLKDEIISENSLGNIKRVKDLTNFTDFITDGLLNKEAYLHQLRMLSLPGTLLDNIIDHDKIDYQDNSGNSYIRELIRNNEDLDAILRFIRDAKSRQLNTQEDNGLTFLHEATLGWERCKKAKDDNGMTNYRKIIKVLLKNGAIPTIADNEGVMPSMSKFFRKNRELCRQWHEKYAAQASSSSAPAPVKSRKTAQVIQTKKPKSSRITTLIGLSIIGVATLYLGCKILHKNKVVTVIKPK